MSTFVFSEESTIHTRGARKVSTTSTSMVTLKAL
jgi:hypothetical protein